jgi:dTMP kinase
MEPVRRGIFICLEGGDGSGKTSLAERICEWFSSKGMPLRCTREPTGPLRDIIKSHPWDPFSELLLMEAARTEHVKSVKEALSSGITVVCDRFIHSTLAYQGYARGISLDLIEQLNTLATSDLRPDLVIWVKVDPETAVSRLEERARLDQTSLDRIDSELLGFHRRVYRGYEEMSLIEADKFVVLDGSQEPNKVFEELLNHPLWIDKFKF